MWKNTDKRLEILEELIQLQNKQNKLKDEDEILYSNEIRKIENEIETLKSEYLKISWK
jgi:hypothetical protein